MRKVMGATITIMILVLTSCLLFIHSRNLKQPDGFHIVILSGDKIEREIIVPRSKFVFLFNDYNIAWKDTSNDEPVWSAPMSKVLPSGVLGVVHKQMVIDRLGHGRKR